MLSVFLRHWLWGALRYGVLGPPWFFRKGPLSILIPEEPQSLMGSQLFSTPEDLQTGTALFPWHWMGQSALLCSAPKECREKWVSSNYSFRTYYSYHLPLGQEPIHAKSTTPTPFFNLCQPPPLPLPFPMLGGRLGSGEGVGQEGGGAGQ